MERFQTEKSPDQLVPINEALSGDHDTEETVSGSGPGSIVSGLDIIMVSLLIRPLVYLWASANLPGHYPHEETIIFLQS